MGQVTDAGRSRLRMRISRRDFLIGTSAAAIVACAPPAVGPSPTSSTTSASIPKGGVARLALIGDPAPINAVLNLLKESQVVRASVTNALTRLDPVTRKAVPDLATKWDVSSDGLTWTFQLRDDVKWHDGRRFTADDVKFTIDRILDPAVASSERTRFGVVKQVDAVNPTTIRFLLERPLVSLPILVGWTPGILPKHLLDGKDLRKETEFNKAPIGTGPFKVKTVAPGSFVEVVANEEFFRGRPHLDGIVFKIIPDGAVRLAQVRSGELDYVVIEPTGLAALQGQSGVATTEYENAEAWYYRINLTNPLFKDKRVRQAMTYGLDREAIMRTTTLGHAQLMTTVMPIGMPFWYHKELKPYPFDVAKAKSLFSEAGWVPGTDGVLTKDGQRFAFSITLENVSGVRKQMAELAQQQWKAIGIDMSLDLVSRAVFNDKLVGGTFGATVSAVTSLYDPDDQRNLYGTTGVQNFSKYSNPEVDRLLAAGAIEQDETKRQAIYKQYQEIVYDDCNVVSCFYPKEIVATNAKLKGLPIIDYQDIMAFTDSWYMEK